VPKADIAHRSHNSRSTVCEFGGTASVSGHCGLAPPTIPSSDLKHGVHAIVSTIGSAKTDDPEDYDALHKIEAGYKVALRRLRR